MRPTRLIRCLFPLLLGLGLTTGCDRSSVPPKPITTAELPPALEQAFAKAKPEIKELAGQIGASLRAQDFSTAYFGMQTLCGMSGLSREQGSIVTRGMLGMNTTLQTAQSHGDQKSADALRWQHANK